MSANFQNCVWLFHDNWKYNISEFFVKNISKPENVCGPDTSAHYKR